MKTKYSQFGMSAHIWKLLKEYVVSKYGSDTAAIDRINQAQQCLMNGEYEKAGVFLNHAKSILGDAAIAQANRQ